MPTIPLSIPKIGESVSEATITQWFKKVGDAIEKDEIFVEITTDKVTSELPSEYEGVLQEIIIPANEMVAIGSTIGTLEVTEEVWKLYQKTHQKIGTTEQEHAVQKSDNTLLEIKELNAAFLSPVVRKIALEENLSVQELEKIPTTGNANRLTKKDVLNYLQKKNIPTSNNYIRPTKLDLPITSEDWVKPLIGIRKKAADILEESYREIPHVTTMVEADVAEMVRIRNQRKKEFYAKYQLKLTYTHYCFYAALKALEKYPQLNSWFNQDEWIWKKSVNLGFATSLPNDVLVVPNIKDAQENNFQKFVEAINKKAEKAKTNHLEPIDFQDTTFTISNTGIFGSLMGTPIITKPQVAVLALGEIREQLELNEKKEIHPTKKMYASLSYDHRVINGAIASKFLVEFKNQLVLAKTF